MHTHTHAQIDIRPLLSCVSLCTNVREPASFSLMHMTCTKTFRWIALSSTIFVDLYVLSSVKKNKKQCDHKPLLHPTAPLLIWTAVHHKPLSVNFDILWITLEHLKWQKPFFGHPGLENEPRYHIPQDGDAASATKLHNFMEIQNIVVFVCNVGLSFSSSLVLVQKVQPFLQNIS